MGSGSINAYAVLENGFTDDLTLAEAKQLAIDAIKAGIIYDLGSGSNVDLVIMTKGNVEHLRNFEIVGKKEIKKPTPYKFIPRNIEILKEEEIFFNKDEEESGMIIEK